MDLMTRRRALMSLGAGNADNVNWKAMLTAIISGDAYDVVIPDGVTAIRNEAFRSFSAMTSIVIPNTVVSIGNSSFYTCTGLTSITIPDSVESIGVSAFQNCNNMANITIGEGVTSISQYCFWNIKPNAVIRILATTPPTLTDQYQFPLNASIYVPDDSVDAYKSAWSSYASKIYPLSDYTE